LHQCIRPPVVARLGSGANMEISAPCRISLPDRPPQLPLGHQLFAAPGKHRSSSPSPASSQTSARGNPGLRQRGLPSCAPERSKQARVAAASKPVPASKVAGPWARNAPCDSSPALVGKRESPRYIAVQPASWPPRSELEAPSAPSSLRKSDQHDPRALNEQKTPAGSRLLALFSDNLAKGTVAGPARRELFWGQDPQAAKSRPLGERIPRRRIARPTISLLGD